MAQKGIIINTNEAGHVDASDHAFLFKSIFGDSGILNIGNKLAVTKINNNKIRLNSGIYIMSNGVPIKIDGYEDFTIISGTLGRKRKDAVIAEYIKDGNGEGDDIARIRIITGDYAVSDPQLPAISNTETKLQEIIYTLTINETALTIDNTLPKFIKTLNNVTSFTYSTEEQWTGEYWLDGKKIYTKTIQSTINLFASGNVRHNITNIGTYRTFDMNNSFWLINDNRYCLGRYESPTAFISPGNIGNTHLNLFVGSDWSGDTTKPVYITIRYTKEEVR